jgi:hypothetical protein
MKARFISFILFAFPLFDKAQNVGIGTTTPNAPLQFSNTVANRKIVLYEDANNDHQVDGFGISPGILRYQVSTTAISHVFYAGTSSTTSNELMRIQGNGYVGIGTSSPGYPLSIGGTNSGGGVFGVDNNAFFVAKNTSGGAEAYLVPRTNANETLLKYGTGGFILSDNSNNYRMFMTNGGNLGVGTISPGNRLSVVGNADFSGNVGIGTVTPTFPLTIVGSNLSNGVFGLDNGTSLFAKNSAGVYERAFSPRWSDNITYINYGSAGFNILTNGGLASAMFMNNSGNVGIGTVAPATKLDVEGGITLTNAMDISNGNVGIGVLPFSNTKLEVKSNQVFGVFIDGSCPAGGDMLNVQGTSQGNLAIFQGTATSSLVHIGGSSTNGYNLLVNGTAGKTDGLAFWSLPSDARLKEQIIPYKEGLAELLKINPVKYHYTKASGYNNSNENIGILAQELKVVAPYMVFKKKGENTNEEFYNVNLSPMLFMFVNAFKEVNETNKKLEESNKKLEDRVGKLEQMVQSLVAKK